MFYENGISIVKQRLQQFENLSRKSQNLDDRLSRPKSYKKVISIIELEIAPESPKILEVENDIGPNKSEELISVENLNNSVKNEENIEIKNGERLSNFL